MKKNFAKIILTMALTVLFVGSTTTVAQAHHGHSSNRASQDTTGYQGGHCYGGEYCEPNPACPNNEYCEPNPVCPNNEYCEPNPACPNNEYCEPNPAYSNAGYNTGRRHHANFYCGSREEYYSRRGSRINCLY